MQELNDYLITVKDFAQIINVTEKAPYKIFKTEESIRPIEIGKRLFLTANSIHEYRVMKGTSPNMIGGEKVLVMYNAKGGVGKTTLTFNIAIRCVMIGMKVLCVDMDMQSNLTKSFKIENPKDHSTFLNIFERSVSIEEAIIPITPTLHLIPANISLGRLNNRIDFKEGFEHIREHLNLIRDDYDLIIIDCGPSINNINFATLCAANLVLSPVYPDTLSEEGLELTMEELDKVRKRGLNPRHKILINHIDMRENSSKQFFIRYTSNYGDQIASSIIRKSTDLSSAISDRKSIFEFNPKAGSGEDINALVNELVGIETKFINNDEGSI